MLDFIEFKDISKFLLFLRGFDPYSPLYSLISDLIFKLVSLVIVLTRVCVYSMTAQNHLIKQPNGVFIYLCIYFCH